MSRCEDCGCRTSGGICSNCQEELYILSYQGEHVESVSPEFLQKANEQEALLESRKEI